MAQRLRIHADFNSRGPGEHEYWNLWHAAKPLDEVATLLGLFDGMPIRLVDADEEFECDAVLKRLSDASVRWIAEADMLTLHYNR